jgi:3-deoxy-manno-octulosonate cytidylyltransferase (CMP-KDO synthetase)
MSAIVVIPARYASTRFPGKPLCLLSGKPLIQHVYERVKEARLVSSVIVATDDRRIYDAVEAFGGEAVMTLVTHQSGTDRIAEVVMNRPELAGDAVIVNVQGDEPLINPGMVDDVIGLMEDERVSIGTLVKRIEDAAEGNDPNVVKAVFNSGGFALYFSRSPIPYHRDFLSADVPKMFKHIGIYAYTKSSLLSFAQLPQSELEKTEKLEQLRALENGLTIKVRETSFETIGVDTPEDLERVEKCLSISL